MVSRSRIAAIGLSFVGVLVGARAACELAMIKEHGSDPQIPIWYMFMFAKLICWLLFGGILASLIAAFAKHRFAFVIGLLALLLWSAAIVAASSKYIAGRQALADAGSPSASPERLEALVHFRGIQAGYELDNRLASNPNTPARALRALSKRNQAGTNMILNRNPNTPKDVLEKLPLMESW